MCNINGSKQTHLEQNIGMFSAAYKLWLLPKCFVYLVVFRDMDCYT